jgi:signal transduction histidine kinase
MKRGKKDGKTGITRRESEVGNRETDSDAQSDANAGNQCREPEQERNRHMQQADRLRETAHKPDDPAIAVAMMIAAIGSTHEPKSKTASATSDDARSQGRDCIAPERIRTSSNVTGPNLMSPALMSPGRTNSNLMNPDLMRAETLAATLAALRSENETLAEVAHDARNMVTALGLYCEFLEEPGVLATPFLHYGQELRLVAAASRRLVEKIVALNYQTNAQTSAQTNAAISAEAAATLAILAAGLTPAGLRPAALGGVAINTPLGAAESGTAHEPPTASDGAKRETEIFQNPNRRWDLLPTVPVANLAAELAVNRNLLAALAGPSIALTVHAEGCARPVWLSGEDLTRVLVNLVKNSAEAMLSGGRIDICLREQAAEQAPQQPGGQSAAAFLLLTVEDNGPGIPAEREEAIFVSGFTSHGISVSDDQGSPANWSPNHHGPNRLGHGHRGLGLTISRSIIEGAGGRITAANREQGGARFALELPLRQAT